MCGIFFFKSKKLDNFKEKINLAINHQIPRGPDMKNIFSHKDFLMGFNYLKITSGNKAVQPFKFHDVIIIFNGEIYNFEEIKKKLIKKYKIKFITNSDTEVAAAAINFFGLKYSLKIFRGMFSIIGYNFKKKLFFVARDRFGIKPLFYYKEKKILIMASTVEAIRIAIGSKLNIKKNTIENFLRKGDLDLNNKTFFQGIYSFPAGSYAFFRNTLNIKNLSKFWELKTYNKSKDSNIEDIKKEINKTFEIHKFNKKSAILLSGGLDSNIIDYNYKNLFRVSLIGQDKFEDQTIKQLSKEKKIKVISNKQINFELNLKKLAKVLDQPVRSSHWVYQFYLRNLIKNKYLRVLYSGDGADEVFGGYYYAYRYYLNEKKNNLAKEIKNKNVITEWLKNNQYNPSLKKKSLKDFLKYRIVKTHIPYWLRVEDEISMNNSIETRVPFLDHIVVEKTFLKNSDIFFSRNKNKNILRKIYSKNLKRIILDQKKVGKPRFPHDTFLLFRKYRNKISKLSIIKNSKYFKKIFKHKNNYENINIDFLFRILFLYFWFNKKKHLYKVKQ